MNAVSSFSRIFAPVITVKLINPNEKIQMPKWLK